jgi:hypothetical protein
VRTLNPTNPFLFIVRDMKSGEKNGFMGVRIADSVYRFLLYTGCCLEGLIFLFA